MEPKKWLKTWNENAFKFNQKTVKKQKLNLQNETDHWWQLRKCMDFFWWAKSAKVHSTYHVLAIMKLLDDTFVWATLCRKKPRRQGHMLLYSPWLMCTYVWPIWVVKSDGNLHLAIIIKIIRFLDPKQPKYWQVNDSISFSSFPLANSNLSTGCEKHKQK